MIVRNFLLVIALGIGSHAGADSKLSFDDLCASIGVDHEEPDSDAKPFTSTQTITLTQKEAGSTSYSTKIDDNCTLYVVLPSAGKDTVFLDAATFTPVNRGCATHRNGTFFLASTDYLYSETYTITRKLPDAIKNIGKATVSCSILAHVNTAENNSKKMGLPVQFSQKSSADQHVDVPAQPASVTNRGISSVKEDKAKTP